MKTETLIKAMDHIVDIYDMSKYDSEVDLYRIRDVANSFVTDQISSKEWLVDEVMKFREDFKLYGYSFLIAGGWYGLLGHLFKERNEDFVIVSVDMDPVCETIGNRLFPDINFVTDDIYDVIRETRMDHSWLINTSCEHMEQDDIDFLLQSKAEHTFVCLQSNNMFNEASHINCHETLDDFAKSLNLKDIFRSFEMDLGSGYKRFMVIGK